MPVFLARAAADFPGDYCVMLLGTGRAGIGPPRCAFPPGCACCLFRPTARNSTRSSMSGNTFASAAMKTRRRLLWGKTSSRKTAGQSSGRHAQMASSKLWANQHRQ